MPASVIQLPTKSRKSPLESLRDQITNDPASKTFRVAIKRITTGLNLVSIDRELATIQAARKSRKLNARLVLYKKKSALLSAQAENTANRSRVVEIQMQIALATRDMQPLIDAYYSYLMHVYNEPMVELKYKSKGDRDQFLAQFYEKATAWQARSATTVANAELMIKDFDEAKWSMNAIAKEVDRLQEEKYG